MKCDLCPSSAVVHIQEVVEGQHRTLNLCQQCAEERGITPDSISPANIGDLLTQMAQIQDAEQDAPWPERSCDRCGMTSAAAQEDGRLGCIACYEVFEDLIRNTLSSCQHGELHTGKRPGSHNTVPRSAVHEEVARDGMRRSLQKRLEDAIEAENYELAQHLHDELNELEIQHAN